MVSNSATGLSTVELSKSTCHPSRRLLRVQRIGGKTGLYYGIGYGEFEDLWPCWSAGPDFDGDAGIPWIPTLVTHWIAGELRRSTLREC